MIAPDVKVGLTVLQWSDGMVPVVDIVQTLSMAHATTRESYEFGFKVGDDLCQILTKPVLTVHECLLREQTHHIDAALVFLQSCDGQTSLAAGLLSRKHCLILLPVVPLGFYLGLGNHLSVLSHQRDDEVFLQLALAF